MTGQDLRARLSHPVGRYDAHRASQLSGVPERTVWHWAQIGVVVPDYAGKAQMRWSYRDLVLLRLAAWLRSKNMAPQWVAERVTAVRRWLEDPESDFTHLRSQGQSMVVGDESIDRVSGELLIPQVVKFLSVFDLFATLHAAGRRRVWGPDLLRPTTRVRIFPWVMAGEPCIERTRVPTSTLYAIHDERGLSPTRIAELYPRLSADDVVEAIDLESRLRQRRAA